MSEENKEEKRQTTNVEELTGESPTASFLNQYNLNGTLNTHPYAHR